jgi:hypothetical protein
MIIFISSVITSTYLGKLYLCIGRKKTFTLGAFFQVVAMVLLMVPSHL